MFEWKCPIDPVHAPLGDFSISFIAAIEAIFGQPVIEPPGNKAEIILPKSISEINLPDTPLTKCWTVDNASIRKSDQCTLPGSQILDKSCFLRSTNIRCSAISFSDETISTCRFLSSSREFPLG